MCWLINRSTKCHFEILAILGHYYSVVSKCAENLGLYSWKKKKLAYKSNNTQTCFWLCMTDAMWFILLYSTSYYSAPQCEMSLHLHMHLDNSWSSLQVLLWMLKERGTLSMCSDSELCEGHIGPSPPPSLSLNYWTYNGCLILCCDLEWHSVEVSRNVWRVAMRYKSVVTGNSIRPAFTIVLNILRNSSEATLAAICVCVLGWFIVTKDWSMRYKWFFTCGCNCAILCLFLIASAW